MRAAPLAAAGLLVATALLAGCLAEPLGALERPAAVPGKAWSMALPITMNVVLVGTGDRIDPDSLLPALPTSRPVYNLVEFSKTHEVDLEPIQYELTWRVHRAPPAFESAFFEAAKAATFEGPAPKYLIDYDRTSAQGRLAQGPGDLVPGGLPVRLSGDHRMDYVDAPTVEAWIQEHRAEHGLAFPQPEYTLFVVDSWSDAGLPQDRYHYWYFDDGTIDAELDRAKDHEPIDPRTWHDFHTPKDPTSNRGWGGKWGFAWIDLGAAPSWLDHQPWVPAFEDDNVDHPIWECVPATDACDAAKLHRNLARHLGDAALVKIVRTPIYDFEYAEKWVFPVHVFYEATAVSGASAPAYGVDVHTWFQPERIEAAFEEAAPWIDTEVTVEFHELPGDDPGMAEAVRLAKLYGDPTVVSAGVIKEHVRAHWDEYVPEEAPGTRVLPQFTFFFDGLYTFWGPNQGGGFADGDGWGRPWAAFNHIFDLCAKTDQVPCTKATKWRGAGTLDMLVIHEGGHHIGYTHARDTGILLDDGTDEYYANWFWDSTWSVMTYRHQNPAFDGYDKDTVARGHAAWALDGVARRAHALAPDDPARRAAEDGIRATEELLFAGRWQDAARRAVATLEATPDAGAVAVAATEGRVESFGASLLRPVALGAPGAVPEPATPLDSAVRAWTTDLEVGEGATYVHVAFRDTRPQIGTLRNAWVALKDPEGVVLTIAEDDVFAESFVTGLGGPGTYTAYLVTDGGLASEYELTLDVHYA